MFKCSIRKIRVNNGGYDSSGTYHGEPYYRAEIETADDYVVHEYNARDYDRDSVKAEILRQYPEAKFYK